MPPSVVPAPLPPWPVFPGPVTQSLWLRTLGGYAGLALLGAVLALQEGMGAWRAVGAGLLWPGAGWCLPMAGAPFDGLSLAVGLGVLLLLFPLALMLWFATGNAAAPPLVWLGAALTAALRPGTPSDTGIHTVLGLAALALAAVALSCVVHRRLGRRRRQQAQRRLTQATRAWPTVRLISAPTQPASARSLVDLQRARFLLDRALQPLAHFEGFEWRDQYQTAAVRYQLQFAGYALSTLQATQPAFSGYLREGQRQLVRKLADRRVWRYWASESLWGHGRRQPNPTARDNIMYTGFSALQMVMAQAASGSREWLQPNSLVLRHPRQGDYPADLSTLGQALQRDLTCSPFTLMACEPNWVYPLCNTLSACALAGLEAQTGEACWRPHADRFRQALCTEFMAPSGHFVAFRSTYTGLAAPAMGGALPVAMTCLFLHALWPDLAWQQWLLLRERLLRPDGQALRSAAFWSLDVGNYRRSPAAALAGTALAARELGDEAVAQLCLAALDEHHPEVVQGHHRHRPSLSVWGHALELMARAGSAGAFRRLVHQPRLPAMGPCLAQVPYHQLMVASALATPHGLHAVLVPLHPGRHTVAFSGLPVRSTCLLQVDGQLHTLNVDVNGQASMALAFQTAPRTLCLTLQGAQNPWPVV